MFESLNPQLTEPESPGFVARAWRVSLLLALLFLLAYLPILPQVSLWRGDERFYTDAAIQMVHSGDYITPRFFDGSERFHKPGLLYWILAASYNVFGINYLTTRLPFLLAGACILLLTHACARILFRSSAVAVCAVAILASNPTLFRLSVRSTPDVILVFFMLLSSYGLLKILFDGDRRFRFYFIAYGAAGLAVATKGLLGVLPVLYAVLFGVWKRPGNLKSRELFYGPALVTGLGLAALWFLLVYAKHGTDFLMSFFDDQVGSRISGGKFYVLDNLVTYPGTLLCQFLPWTLLVGWMVVRYRALVREEFRRRSSAYTFIGLWLGLLFVIFVSANIQRARYFLPAYPFLAMAIGALLVRAQGMDRMQRAVETFDRCLTWVLGLAGVGILLAGRHFVAFQVSGLVLIVYALARRWTDRRLQSVLRYVAAAIGILLFFALIDGLIRPVLLVSPAPELARRLAAEKAGRHEVAAWEVNTNYVTQLRVLSGGAIYPAFLTGDQTPEQLEAYPYVICNDRRRDDVARHGYDLHPGGYMIRKWKWRQLGALFRTADPGPVLAGQSQPYYLGIRRKNDDLDPVAPTRKEGGLP